MRLKILFVVVLAAAGLHANPLADFNRAENILDIESIFDQGRTEWCWAYSTFHTLRTYYHYVLAGSGDAPGAWDWHAALTDLDTPEAFRTYLGNHFSPGQTGFPRNFLRLLEQDNPKLVDAGWQDFYAGDHESVRYRALPDSERARAMRLSSREILNKVHQNLKKQIPSVFCTSVHCMMIFGDKDDGSQPTEFEIADSVHGVVHHLSTAQTASILDLVMTLP